MDKKEKQEIIDIILHLTTITLKAKINLITDLDKANENELDILNDLIDYLTIIIEKLEIL